MSYPYDNEDDANPASGPSGRNPTGPSLSSSALFHLLLSASQSNAGQNGMQQRRGQDLERGLTVGPADSSTNSEKDDDSINQASRTPNIPNRNPDTTNANGNGRPSNLTLLARYLAMNAANQASAASTQNIAEEEPPEVVDPDSDAHITSVIRRINPSTYPIALTDIKRLMMDLPSTPGACIGEPSAKALATVLHDSEATEHSMNHLPMFEHSYYLKYTTDTFNSGKFRPLPKEFIAHLHHLLVYLRDSPEPKTPAGFIEFLKDVGGEPNVSVEFIWELLQFPLFLFSSKPQDPAMSFSKYISTLFPPSKRRREKFSVKLDEILAVGLKVEPVTLLGRHLEIENRTVYIYRPSNSYMLPMHKYKHNRIAQVLNVSTLGSEVASSLNALYGHSAELTKLAGDLHIKPEAGYPGLFEGLLMVNRTVEPKVLAGRMDALEDLIAHEGVWWRALIRDTKRRSQERPFEFWGAILAALFSVTAIIQTVASIISTIYTIRQYQVALASLPNLNAP